MVKTISSQAFLKVPITLKVPNQIDPITGEILQEFSSAKDAGDSFGKPRANSEIIKVCRNYVSPKGKHYKTALGFKWKYKNEGSTTRI